LCQRSNHLEALELSGLNEPGALISVKGLGEKIVRYQVDSDGSILELARYGSCFIL